MLSVESAIFEMNPFEKMGLVMQPDDGKYISVFAICCNAILALIGVKKIKK